MSQAKFEKAVATVQALPKDGPIKPTQDQQLVVCVASYRTIGDVNIPRPGMLDFVGKAKWDAWDSIKGTTKEEAWKKYVEQLLEILKQHESEELAKNAIAEIEAA
ncbi:hypothetical protein HWV62_2334 [Athelia sp. TMB]|nr:hypothetical protein HWV62_40756 [Athelia sp. TMB]KAF7985730.1 hypothetical protein HWV62_2334 [Athelia sp. TMB]